MHRLDKDTSGLIIFALNQMAHQHLSQQFEQRQTKKIYHGLLIGSPVNKQGSIDAPIGEHPAKNGTMIVHRKGKESLTDYEVLEDFGIYSWVQFQIHTGRTHQIRVHMQYVGHPIVCDDLYGDGEPVYLSSIKKNYHLSKNELEERPLLNRLALHAHRLSFVFHNKKYEFEAPLAKDLSALLQQLRKVSQNKIQ